MIPDLIKPVSKRWWWWWFLKRNVNKRWIISSRICYQQWCKHLKILIPNLYFNEVQLLRWRTTLPAHPSPEFWETPSPKPCQAPWKPKAQETIVLSMPNCSPFLIQTPPAKKWVSMFNSAKIKIQWVNSQTILLNLMKNYEKFQLYKNSMLHSLAWAKSILPRPYLTMGASSPNQCPGPLPGEKKSWRLNARNLRLIFIWI